MATSTTPTRFPALAHIIERPRLIAQLEEPETRVLLLAAPAGFGKTTLAQQWADRQTTPVSWYRATRASSDVAALAVGLDQSLSELSATTSPDPTRVEAIAAANPSPEPLGRVLLRRHGDLPPDVLLIVDEWETAASKDAERLLGMLVKGLRIRYLITSRKRPRWFARLAVYGEARDVGVDALTMTDDEAREVLSQRPSTEAAQALVERAAGWPAVIGLAALSPTRLPEQALLPQMLYDFLAGELLDAAPPQVERALLLIAAASIRDMDAARLVLGSGADDVLRDAADRGVIALADDDRRISVHPLFRELLLSRLRRSTPEERSALVERLDVLRDHRRWEECVSTADTLSDAAFAVATLRAATEELLRLGRVATLRRLVEIGRTAEHDDAFLDYAEGEIAFLAGALDLALALGSHAAARLEGDERPRAHLLAAQAALLTDRSELATTHYNLASDATSREIRTAALWGLFNRATEEQASDAEAALATFAAEAEPTMANLVRTAAGSLRLGLLRGDLRRRLREAETALPLLNRTTDPMAITGFLNAYGYVLALNAQYEESLAVLDRELQTAEEFDLGVAIRFVLHHRASVLTGLRRFALAERALRDLGRREKELPDQFLKANLLMQRARIHLSTGDTHRAADMLLLDPDKRNSRGTIGEYLALRSLALAGAGQADEAAHSALRAENMSGHIEVSALTSVTRAINLSASGASQARIDREFTRALSTEVYDAVVIGLRASSTLLMRVGRQPRWHRDLQRILMRSNDATLAARIGLAIPRAARRTETLSPRELEIHELVARGLTNKEIAVLLYISESTTKVHVRHILEKLAVRSRVEAARVWEAPEEA